MAIMSMLKDDSSPLFQFSISVDKFAEFLHERVVNNSGLLINFLVMLLEEGENDLKGAR